MTIRQTRLWFKEGTSDKVYVAQVIKTDGYYEVRGQWGRRGRTMQEQVKGRYVTEWAAVAAYNALVAEKCDKGYRITDKLTVKVVPTP